MPLWDERKSCANVIRQEQAEDLFTFFDNAYFICNLNLVKPDSNPLKP